MGWEFTLLFVSLLCVVAAIVFLFKRKHRKLDNSKKTCGVLNIDCSDPADGPYLYLELTVPITDITDRKQVSFLVNVIPNISQK